MNLPQSNPAFAKRLLLKVRAATTILDQTANLPQTVKAVSHFTCKEGVCTEFKATAAKMMPTPVRTSDDANFE